MAGCRAKSPWKSSRNLRSRRPTGCRTCRRGTNVPACTATRSGSRSTSAAGWSAFLLLAAVAPARPAPVQETAKKPAEAKPAAAQNDDYLVQVGKHVMWKSQVEKMHPELKSRVLRLSKANKNDFLVQVG